MPERWGLGPVFAYESLVNARRWQVYAGRSLFVSMLLAGMVIVWREQGFFALAPVGYSVTFQQLAKLGKGFFYALAGIQVSLVLLAAPAATAGSICLDRARGTLLHMMVTDLSDVEIVLGKLAARLAPIVGLIACGVPVAALAALLGGIDFGALFGAFAVSLALAVFGCALALAISVRATKTHEVLMAVYLIEGLWLLALPLWWGSNAGAPPAWFQKANPYVLVFAPYNQPGLVGASDYSVFVGVVLGLSAALLGLSTATLRRAVVEPAGRAESASRWPRLTRLRNLLPSWPGPTLDGNPVLWREWHRNRPSRLARRLWAVVMILTWGLAAWGTYQVIAEGSPPGRSTIPLGFVLQVFFGLLMLSATVPTALAEERIRGSLDVLMSTPLSTASIVAGKWWGAYRAVLRLMPLPLFTGIVVAVMTPDTPTLAVGMRLPWTPIPLTAWDRSFSIVLGAADFLASGAVLVSLGLALATWVARLGRAVVLGVIAYVATGIGWIILVEWLFSAWASFQMRAGRSNPYENRWLSQCVIALSPFAGPFGPISVLENSHDPRTRMWIGLSIAFWIKASFAGLLLWLTVRTFDRRLGRVPEPRPLARTESFTTSEDPVPSVT